jgi:hypothetical protein
VTRLVGHTSGELELLAGVILADRQTSSMLRGQEMTRCWRQSGWIIVSGFGTATLSVNRESFIPRPKLIDQIVYTVSHSTRDLSRE